MESPVSVGDILGGKFAVERIVACGGTGVVVRARHLALREVCAIKLMRADVGDDPTTRARFLREARAIARLKSDHVVRVFDVGELEDATPYMVMEYLEGVDLEVTIRQQGALPLVEAARYVVQICAALAEAHRSGIVHRDLKPGNVVVTRGEGGAPRLKLIDFGISKVLGADDPILKTTQEGTILGTPLYMAPEQIMGASVDARTDVWAVGMILYELVTGRTPFAERSAVVTTLAHILSAPPTPPSAHVPDLPREVEAIILRCLEKRPAARPASVGEIVRVLERFTEVRAPAEPHREAPSPPRVSATRRWMVGVAIALLVCGVAAGALATTSSRERPTPEAAVPIVLPLPRPADAPRAQPEPAASRPEEASSARPAPPAPTSRASSRPARADGVSPSAGFNLGDRH
jgi:serine/threonine-protein kinase